MSYPAVSIREHVAAGPRFQPDLGQPDSLGNCDPCGARAITIDVVTGLCRACWRCWRWAPKREEGQPGAPAQPTYPIFQP